MSDIKLDLWIKMFNKEHLYSVQVNFKRRWRFKISLDNDIDIVIVYLYFNRVNEYAPPPSSLIRNLRFTISFTK